MAAKKLIRVCAQCGAEKFVSAPFFCSRDCFSAYRLASAPRRFWARVEKTDTCWLWNGPRGTTGYGKFWYESMTVTAHRFSYMMAHGQIPKGMHICHKCDNPSCVNPDHLFLGTPADNIRDLWAKGHGATGEKSGARKHPECRPKGESQGLAKLTEIDVRAIRELYAAGLSYAKIGRQFNVTGSTICHVVRRKTWRHVA